MQERCIIRIEVRMPPLFPSPLFLFVRRTYLELLFVVWLSLSLSLPVGGLRGPPISLKAGLLWP